MKNHTCQLNNWNMTAERDGSVFASPILGDKISVQRRVSEYVYPPLF